MKKGLSTLIFALLLAMSVAGTAAASSYNILFANQDLVIRRSPQNNSEVVARALRNDLILVHSCDNGVCNVSHPQSTVTGYVPGAQIRFNAAVSTFPRVPTEGFGVTNQLVNIRAVPWQHGIKLGEILASRRVKRDRCHGNYCYIYMESGTQGWVHKDGLTMDRVLNNIHRLPTDHLDTTTIFRGPLPNPLN